MPCPLEIWGGRYGANHIMCLDRISKVDVGRRKCISTMGGLIISRQLRRSRTVSSVVQIRAVTRGKPRPGLYEVAIDDKLQWCMTLALLPQVRRPGKLAPLPDRPRLGRQARC